MDASPLKSHAPVLRRCAFTIFTMYFTGKGDRRVSVIDRDQVEPEMRPSDEDEMQSVLCADARGASLSSDLPVSPVSHALPIFPVSPALPDMRDASCEIRTEINDGLVITERRDGLTFGTDALLLSAFVRRSPRSVGVELGCGTGAISLLLAKRNKLSKIHALELVPALAALTARNAEDNGLSFHVIAHRADVRTWRFDSADVVFSNPPYYVCGGRASEHALRQIAMHEMNGTLGDFCRAAARMLRYGGLFYTVCRPDRTVDLFCAMRQAGLEPKVAQAVCRDSRHAPSLLLTQAKKGARSGLRQLRDLYLTEDGVETPEYRYILDNGDFMPWN